MQTFEVKEFLHQVAEESQGDYTVAFKLLGFMVYVAQEGSESLMTGKMISERTYYRWLELVQRAGWGDLLADARLRKVIQDYLWKRFAGLPIDQARDRVLRVVTDLVEEIEARSINANGGSIGESMAPIVGCDSPPLCNTGVECTEINYEICR